MGESERGAELMQRKWAHLLPVWAQQLFIICAMCQGIRFERVAELEVHKLYFIFFEFAFAAKAAAA